MTGKGVGDMGLRIVIAAGLIVAGPTFTGTGPALAAGPGPYDMTYAIRGGVTTPLLADMKDGAAVIGAIPAGAAGIVLRWCRSEIPFGSWQFGSRKDQLKLLDGRWCEVSYKGKVGNVPGRVLQPE